MPLPKNVQDLFNDFSAVKVLATKTGDLLHVIPVGSMCAPDVNTIALASIFMRETHENLARARETGEKVSTLVVKASPREMLFLGYQVRCKVKGFETSGPIYENISEALRGMGLKVNGVWILEPLEVYDQSPGPNVGKRIA